MGETYDFTTDADAMDKATRSLYYRLRRVAILAGDAELLPDGKTLTAADVAAQLGETTPAAPPAEDVPCCN